MAFLLNYKGIGVDEKVNRWKHGKRILMGLAMLALALSGCSLKNQGEPNPLNPKGSVAEEQYWLILLSIGVMVFVMAVVFILFFYAVVRFRKRPGQTGIPKQVEGNHMLEIVWTVIPVILLTILAVPTVAYTFKHAEDYSDAPPEEVVKVKVTGHQFWWEFEYPDYDIVTAQDLWIPVGKKVFVELHSADVIHSFWIPGLAGKTDTTPGVTSRMYFDAKEPGIYLGKCAELCGAGHALMDFKVIAVPEDEFDAWVSSMTNPPATATEPAAVTGEEVFKAKGCINCHAITPNGASLGPNLNNFGNRLTVGGYAENTSDWVAKWLIDPQDVKDGATMPAVPLTDEEVQALVDYLASLKNYE